MGNRITLFFLLTILLSALSVAVSPSAHAEEHTLKPGAAEISAGEVHYSLNLVKVWESDEWVFTLGQSGYKSISSLRTALESLPKGSKVDWHPSCKRMGNEPLLSNEKELHDFQEHLRSQGIELIVHPSG